MAPDRHEQAREPSLAGLPPDVIVIIVSMTMFQLIDASHRHFVGPRLKCYRRLPFRDRFDWDRRVLNTTFQVLQMFFNGYLLTLDRGTTSDYLYGYSRVAHVGFLIIISFYVYDTCGMVMHPSAPSTMPAWIVHHFIAVGLLAYVVCFKHCSGFPAATFLISAASHIPNELRWFLTANEVQSQTVINLSLMTCFMTVFLTCGLPPPYLLLCAAKQLDASVGAVWHGHMQWYCKFFFFLIYAPHVFLVWHQWRRMSKYWGKPLEPFRVRKVE